MAVITNREDNWDLPIPEPIEVHSIQERPANKSLEDMYNEQRRAADTLQPVLEDRESKLKEFLNVLVNGDEISQLFINNELTEKAREELIKLQDEAADNAKITLRNIRDSIAKLQKSYDELKIEYNNLSRSKDTLSDEVETLKRRKELLTKSMISDLNLMKETLQKEFEQEEKECWEWQVKGWRRIFDISDHPSKHKFSEFDSYIEGKIMYYASVVNCTIDEAREQFYRISPEIKIAKEIANSLKDKVEPDKTIYDVSCSFENFFNALDSIYVPIYGIVETNSKKH